MSVLGGIVKEVAGYVVGRVLERLFGPPKGPTAEELHDALHVGGPTADAAERARREVEEAKLRAAAGRSMVDDEEPTPMHGTPPREDLN